MLKVTSSGCFEGELVKVLQSENSLEISTQTLNDSSAAICPLGNAEEYPTEAIGCALCSSDGFSFSWHSSNISIV